MKLVHKVEQALALGLSTALVAGCGSSEPHDKADSQRSKLSSPAVSTVLNGCDIKQSTAFLKARSQDGKRFEGLTLRGRDKEIAALYVLRKHTSPSDKGIFDPVVLECGKKTVAYAGASDHNDKAGNTYVKIDIIKKADANVEHLSPDSAHAVAIPTELQFTVEYPDPGLGDAAVGFADHSKNMFGVADSGLTAIPISPDSTPLSANTTGPRDLAIAQA